MFAAGIGLALVAEIAPPAGPATVKQQKFSLYSSENNLKYFYRVVKVSRSFVLQIFVHVPIAKRVIRISFGSKLEIDHKNRLTAHKSFNACAKAARIMRY